MPKTLEEIMAESQGQPTTQPGSLPPGVAEQAGLQPYVAGMTIPRTGIRMNFPKPAVVANVDQQREAKSSAQNQLVKKAADQRLQLQQAISLFDKIFSEADTQLPPIRHPALTLPLQNAGRSVGRTMGLRETQRGAIESFRARATPALKALGEVGVLTDQDIQRILTGGFPSDADSSTTRDIKRRGLLSDFQTKLDQVNAMLGEVGIAPNASGGSNEDPYVKEARKRGLLP